jgi:hypothetical protein
MSIVMMHVNDAAMPKVSISALTHRLCSMPPQGALDGGLDIPHNEKRFVGYDASSKEYDAEIMKKYIFGGHVGEYMEEMAEEEPEKYQAHFAKYLEEGLDDCDALEEMYSEVTRSRGNISVTGDQLALADVSRCSSTAGGSLLPCSLQTASMQYARTEQWLLLCPSAMQ